jgi:hypothetical protein
MLLRMQPNKNLYKKMDRSANWFNWKAVWIFLKNLNIELLHDLMIPKGV